LNCITNQEFFGSHGLLLQVSIASARAESESCTVAYAVPETRSTLLPAAL